MKKDAVIESLNRRQKIKTIQSRLSILGNRLDKENFERVYREIAALQRKLERLEMYIDPTSRNQMDYHISIVESFSQPF